MPNKPTNQSQINQVKQLNVGLGALAALIEVSPSVITSYTTLQSEPLPLRGHSVNIADALLWLKRRAESSPATEAELSLKEKKLQKEIEKLEILNAKNSQSLVDPEAIQKQLRVACKNLKTVLEKVGEKYGCTDAIIEAIDKVEVKVNELS